MDEIATSSDEIDKTVQSSGAGDRAGAESGGTPPRDRTNRSAALLATLIAVPVTVAVAGFTFAKLTPDAPAAEPGPAATSAGPQSTAPVEMAAPPLAERPATVCRALTSQLPPTVRDLRQRPVTAGPEQNAAYGDPALTIGCGGAEPDPGDTDDVWLVNKVCWYAVEGPDATVLTTLDRETAVRVTVPHAYGSALQWVSPISDVVVASVPSGGTAPAGCAG
ncbi:hypothetical protein MCAG_04234 [Micromonospora sp. ATCC 39149]|uniref:DUF3515 family protein n=1 Tax=Micromonospora carbonacea TaxID=47853 RepID=A0A7D5YEU5_9ACTN|nr:hypothetical protein MCAG_04234 [Micromonospora sp. ATCC 39149]QLJ99797.1 DUF3515 family protein [Micromonospora carbonacea]